MNRGKLELEKKRERIKGSVKQNEGGVRNG